MTTKSNACPSLPPTVSGMMAADTAPEELTWPAYSSSPTTAAWWSCSRRTSASLGEDQRPDESQEEPWMQLRSDRGEPRQHILADRRGPAHRFIGRWHERDHGDAEFGVLLHRPEEGVGVADRVTHGDHGLVDRVVVTPKVVAVPAQHLELVADDFGAFTEEVARVGVLSHQPQRLPLPSAADQDRRAGLLHRRRDADGFGQPVVPALVRAVAVTPHLQADLNGLREPLEAFTGRGERHAQAGMLPVVPRGPYAEHRAAPREHVQRRDDLREQPGMAVCRPGDQQAEPHLTGVPRQVPEGRVALEHRLRRPAKVLHLEP